MTNDEIDRENAAIDRENALRAAQGRGLLGRRARVGNTRADLIATECASHADRPEWVHCIARTHVDHKNKPWCGGTDRPFFVSLDHAAEHGLQGGRLVACRECVAAASAALQNGHDDRDYPV